MLTTNFDTISFNVLCQPLFLCIVLLYSFLLVTCAENTKNAFEAQVYRIMSQMCHNFSIFVSSYCRKSKAIANQKPSREDCSNGTDKLKDKLYLVSLCIPKLKISVLTHTHLHTHTQNGIHRHKKIIKLPLWIPSHIQKLFGILDIAKDILLRRREKGDEENDLDRILSAAPHLSNSPENVI